ncbi:hypothetical protein V6N11_025432 [Hibiscus sabdariffa]|uniref:Uncharacterized protein n=2 Tax=Hibiscus sabdariffa TaxID=183260 RepID=A0ABR2B9C0_9ROSI
MGNSMDCFFGRVHGVDDRPGSRWCESRSRPPLGRRSVRLEGPIDGCRFRFAVSRPPIGTEFGGGVIEVLMLGEVRRRAGSIETGKIVDIWGNFFKVDGFFDGFVFGQHVWELGMKVLSIEIVQRFCGKGEEGSLVDDWLVVNRVWSWWRYRKKRTYYSGWVCRWFRRRMDWISEEIVGNLPVRFLDKLEGRISIWYWLLGSTGRQNADGRTEFE